MGVKSLAYVAQLRSSADTVPNIKCIHTQHCTDIWSRQGVVDATIFFIHSHTEVSCAKTSEKGSSDGLTIHQSALTIPQQCILYIYDIHYIINTYKHIENTIWIRLCRQMPAKATCTHHNVYMHGQHAKNNDILGILDLARMQDHIVSFAKLNGS